MSTPNSTNSLDSSSLTEELKSIITKSAKIDYSLGGDPDNTQMLSHYHGQPYFENGERWPLSESNQPLEFVFQIFNDGSLPIPTSIRLLQFYYNFDLLPWQTDQDGWAVKVYSQVSEKKSTIVLRPDSLRAKTFGKIKTITEKTLPTLEGLNLYSPGASEILMETSENPFENYKKISEKLNINGHSFSRLGNYPNWTQGDDTPLFQESEQPMNLLFQVDSDDELHLNFGDRGSVYVFYDEITGRVEMVMQSK